MKLNDIPDDIFYKKKKKDSNYKNYKNNFSVNFLTKF